MFFVCVFHVAGVADVVDVSLFLLGI